MMKKRYLFISFSAALCIILTSFILSACLRSVKDYAGIYATNITEKLSMTNLITTGQRYLDNLYILPVYITSAAEASANLDGVYAFDLSTLTTVYDTATNDTKISSFRFGRDTVAVYVECPESEITRFTEKLTESNCFASANAEKNISGGYIVTCYYPERVLTIEGINYD